MTLLKKGDTIGFVAPSSGLEGRDIMPAVRYFENILHLKVKLAPNLSSSYRYMAGTDRERAQTLMQMYTDQEIKALFAIRGAGGSARLLDHLDYQLLATHPKPLFGLSDSSTIQNAIYTKTEIASYTGFLPVYDIKNGKIQSEILEMSLKKALFSDKHNIISGKALITGSTTGKIIGGCLSSFLYLAGTEYMPDFNKKILLIEDTNEKTYKIDQMFNQIRQQKNFQNLSGIIIGKFTNCIITDDFDGNIEDCINDFITNLNIPVIINFDYGHTPNRYIIPLGSTVNITATTEKCTLSW